MTTITKNKTYAKIDKNTVEITETTVTTDVIVSTYILDDLVDKRDGIIADKQSIAIQKDAEIAEEQVHITEAEKLGIVKVKP